LLYPQQNDTRNLLDLSGFWDFALDPDDQGQGAGWAAGLRERLNGHQVRTIAVPASWNEQFEDTRDYLGPAWYARQVWAPSSWAGQRIFLRVGSANYAARVFVNGELVGEHEGGHLPFAFDVTEQLAHDRANAIAIRVENELKPTRVPPGNVRGGIFDGSYPQTSYDFFPYAGLHRPVVLYTVPEQHIEDVTVETRREGAAGAVRVLVRSSGGASAGTARLQGDGCDVSAVLSFRDGSAEAELRVERARLWGPGDPHLYELEVTLEGEGASVDRYTLPVGIRTIEVQGDAVLLNGDPVFLKGFGRHEDSPIHGRGIDPPLIVRDYSLLRWVGANSYRTAHYPYSEEEMQMADRHGILIIDEIPAVGLQFDDGEENVRTRQALCETQLRELIARDKNHPSVIMWSVANEPFPPGFGGGRPAPPPEDLPIRPEACLGDLIALARELDPTRLVSFAAIMGCPAEWMASCDVALVNRYWGWYTHAGQPEAGAEVLGRELDELHERLAKPILISEFGADTMAGHHADPPEMWSEEYQVDLLRRYLDVADKRDFVVGAHVWNFADFKTGQGIRRAASMNLKGVFTRDRRPKMAAHFLRQRWGGGS
jgi:beta-glucuronidase